MYSFTGLGKFFDLFRMNEPPDLGAPGGTVVPPAANFVTISTHSVISNESGMDTDGSHPQKTTRKRIRVNKICKNCNMKKRKHAQAVDGKTGCRCSDTEVSDNANKDTNDINQPIVNPTVVPSTSTSNNGTGTQSFTSVARTIYETTDIAPFVIHVQRETKSPDDGSTLHPVAFGKFLKRNAFQNIINGSVKRIGRNRISLAFSNFSDANSFICCNSLPTNNLRAFIPSFNVTRMGLVRGVPSEWSPEEVIDNISVPSECGKILKVRRINYKTMVEGSPVWKPTQSIVVTFDGQVLPKRIFMCYNALPVDLYTYPTIQCYNCCRFGHTKLQCRSKPKCYKCGNEHTGESCNVEEDCITCCLCSGAHLAISKSCPEFSRQKQIKVTMAEKSISYGEAAKLLPPVSKSYADVVNSVPDRTQPQPHLSSSTSFTQRPAHSSQSYKKTVFMNRRRPAPSPGKGYDQASHQNIINEYNIPIPQDGCALSAKPNNPSLMSTSDIIQLLIETLTRSNIAIPSNVAPIVNMFRTPKAINNGGLPKGDTVELQKCSS